MPGFEPGMKALQASALPLGHIAVAGPETPIQYEGRLVAREPLADLREVHGAEDGIRTRDPNLGKVVLYQLSHFRAKPYISPEFSGAQPPILVRHPW